MANRYASSQSQGHPHDQTGQPYNPNALMNWEMMRQFHGQAVHQATEILSGSPEGVIDGLTISRKSWARNKGKGTIFLVGLIMTPILALGFIVSAVTAHFFPTRIAADEPLQNRAGNAAGRLTSATWKVAKPGIANVYVQSRSEGQEQPPSSVTVGNERLVMTSVGSPGNPATSNNPSEFKGLDAETRQAVDDFLR
ncbi:hypothetical protein IQ249_15030 [Lusitaniella coriacea LEGE 07157]|uniref:Uncharacterized protein n=1 Tax=Lusitaniella coriacea LEGE 07157 TaxID=945747 RepID=A0A8J7IU16_9CYAN|nr:hypothetical protein [Lusitaniella coriacea]MBE9117212.1 hypothetical protein [Lusitaniella coriacea LEGE 07157]